MTIQPLSDATSRVLTSTQTLNNATSIIKELVDNALDARASSIFIEISANTLDKIIVRDDGTGIGIQDRQMLCKRGCTSKIANLDDLANLGGTFLGFRGTALASLAELSKEVTVITKVEGEQPATQMTFGPNGKLLSSSSCSHNDGTSIRVENFLASVPVRRQVILKNPSKVLEDIKKLLYAYALARPGVKLALKVLKARNDKSNWSFASCKDDDILSAAATQIVGKPVVSLCRLHTISSDQDDDSPYRIESLLLAAGDKDLSKAGSVGQFIAVDGRPVSSEKGVMKDLVKKYKTYLQNASTSDKSVPSKPFLLVHLRCPDGSYDVNIEPAKDVVLFHNQAAVLDLVEKLFIDVYGGLSQPEVSNKRAPAANGSVSKKSVSFETLLAKRRPIEAETETDNIEVVAQQSLRDTQTASDAASVVAAPQTSLAQGFAEAMTRPPTAQFTIPKSNNVAPIIDRLESRTPHQSMQFVEDEILDENKTTSRAKEVIDEEDVYDPADVTLNNPFTRAKVFSLQRPGRVMHSNRQLNDINSGSTIATEIDSPSLNLTTPPSAQRVSFNTIYRLPTPVSSPRTAESETYQNPGPPFPRRNRHRASNAEDQDIYDEYDNSEGPRPQSRQVQAGLAGWVNSSPTDGRQFFRSALEMTDQQLLLPSRNPVLDRTTVETGLQPMPKQRPFRPPLKNIPTKFTGYNITDNGQLSGQPSPIPQPNTRISNVQSQNDADLQHILEFEHRKRTINQRQRLNQAKLNPADLAHLQRASQSTVNSGESSSDAPSSISGVENAPVASDLHISSSPPSTVQLPPSKTSNPHQNRYLAAKRHLQTQQPREDVSNLHSPSISITPTESPSYPSEESTHKSPFDSTDPRLYYITHLHRSRSHPDTKATTAEKTQQNRIKSSLFPFESIPISSTNHDLILSFPNPKLNTIATQSRVLSRHDLYIRTGHIEAVTWSTTRYSAWEERLRELLRMKYRHESVGDEVVQRDEEMELEISLAKSLAARLPRSDR